jgi:iron transport multicopper oxidase
MDLLRLYSLLFALFATLIAAETLTYDWNITWVRRNPDGMRERPVIGINNEWPLPQLNITKGDRVVVHVHNQVRVCGRTATPESY